MTRESGAMDGEKRPQTWELGPHTERLRKFNHKHLHPEKGLPIILKPSI